MAFSCATRRRRGRSGRSWRPADIRSLEPGSESGWGRGEGAPEDRATPRRSGEISDQEYIEKADPWPLNPQGELLLGLKIENRRALLYADVTTHVPGVAFAEWGPGDMSMSLGYENRPEPPFPEDMKAARARVLSACKSAGIFFLNSVQEDDVCQMIDEGVMMGSSGHAGEAAAARGREYTGRQMPV